MAEEPKELYKIVFRGELVANMSVPEVRENLKERLRFSDAALDKLFSGKPMILKADLDETTADRYARALWQAGARCNIEPMVAAPPIEVARKEPPPPPQPTMTCPKCGQSQPEAEICSACGVVIAKARQRQEEAAAAPPPEPPEPPPAAPVAAPAPTGTAGEEPAPEAPLPDEGVITWPVIQAMTGTRPWTRLIGILMLLGAGLGLLGGLLTLVGGGRTGLIATGPVFVGQLLFSLLYAVPGWFLLKYSGAIGAFLKGGTVRELEAALAWQRAFWRFIGILTLVMLVLAVLGVVAALMIPGMAGLLGG